MINVIHLSDIWAAKEGLGCRQFFEGIVIETMLKDGMKYYFVKWPKATNGVVGGWYKSSDLLVME